MPVIILGGIYGGIFTATEAAAVAVVYAILVEMVIYRSFGLKVLGEIAESSAITVVVIFILLAMGSMLSFLITLAQVPSFFTQLFAGWNVNWIVFFMIVNVVLLIAGTLNLTGIVEAQDSALGLFGWYWLPLLPMFVVFFISALAETNRPPFDLLEAESELVAGFMVEYSSTPYMLFMLGEYVAIVLMCGLGTVLFLGGWLPLFPVPPFTWIPGVLWFALKACFLFFLIAMVKAMVPRYRYDQLMRLDWKVFLPLSLAMVVIVAVVLQLWHGA